MAPEWDFIIVGGGASGLSLAYTLSISELAFNRVLIFEPETKIENDRTFSYWTTDQHEDPWDSILFKTWNACTFKPHQKSRFDISPFVYKTLRAADFYKFVKTQLQQDTRFVILQQAVSNIETHQEYGLVYSNGTPYKAQWVFNSAYRHQTIISSKPHLWQHFKGWSIKSIEPVFKLQNAPIFMDFTVDQKNDCRFMYVLPYSNHSALIEYTGFSAHTWDDAEYEDAIKAYISTLQISNYTIFEHESGKIPMSANAFKNPYGARVIPIGTAGGCTKMSSGYTFAFILKHSHQICNALLKGTTPQAYKRQWRYEWYDKTLLEVLQHTNYGGAKLFTHLFKMHTPQRLFKFLNEESTFTDELKIMWSMPFKVFIPAAMRAIKHML